ncbi:hypothetical protein GCM10027073_32350 [Streptomyces chlorus]
MPGQFVELFPVTVRTSGQYELHALTAAAHRHPRRLVMLQRTTGAGRRPGWGRGGGRDGGRDGREWDNGEGRTPSDGMRPSTALRCRLLADQVTC